MSIYPSFPSIDIYNDADIKTTVDEKEDEIVNYSYVNKNGDSMSGILSIPLLNFSADGTRQSTAFTDDLKNMTILNNDKLTNINLLDGTTVDISGSLLVNEIIFKDDTLSVDKKQVNAFTTDDKNLIMSNSGNITLNSQKLQNITATLGNTNITNFLNFKSTEGINSSSLRGDKNGDLVINGFNNKTIFLNTRFDFRDTDIQFDDRSVQNTAFTDEIKAQITTNKNDILTLESNIETNTNDILTLESNITTNTSNITNNTTKINDLESAHTNISQFENYHNDLTGFLNFKNKDNGNHAITMFGDTDGNLIFNNSRGLVRFYGTQIELTNTNIKFNDGSIQEYAFTNEHKTQILTNTSNTQHLTGYSNKFHTDIKGRLNFKALDGTHSTSIQGDSNGDLVIVGSNNDTIFINTKLDLRNTNIKFSDNTVQETAFTNNHKNQIQANQDQIQTNTNNIATLNNTSIKIKSIRMLTNDLLGIPSIPKLASISNTTYEHTFDIGQYLHYDGWTDEFYQDGLCKKNLNIEISFQAELIGLDHTINILESEFITTFTKSPASFYDGARDFIKGGVRGDITNHTIFRYNTGVNFLKLWENTNSIFLKTKMKLYCPEHVNTYVIQKYLNGLISVKIS